MLFRRKTTAVASPRKPTSFAGDVLKLATGTTSAQILGVLAAPLIARLFAPEAFGVATVFAAITGILGVIVCLRYECSILLPESDEQAADSAGVSLTAAMLISLLTIPLLWIAGPALLRLLHAPEILPYQWLIPPAVLLAGIYLVLSTWNTRTKQFGRLSLAQLLTSGGSIVAQVVFGLTGHASGGALIIAGLFGMGMATLVLSLQTWSDSARVLLQGFKPERMLAAFKRYIRFPQYSTSAAVMNSVSWQLPAFFLSGFFTTNVVGQYSLGNRLVRLPMNLIGLNVAKVFSQRAAEAKNRGFLASSVETTFRYLLNLSMFPCLVLALTGRDIFIAAFGQRWAEAGVYTQILSVWVCFWFISSPLSAVLSVLEEQAFDLRFNVLILSSRFLSLLIGGLMGNARLALGLFSATGVLVYGYYCTVILHKSGVPTSRMSRAIFSSVMKFAPAGALIAAAEYIFHAPAIAVLALSLALIAIYYLHMLRNDPTGRESVAQILLRAPAGELASRRMNRVLAFLINFNLQPAAEVKTCPAPQPIASKPEFASYTSSDLPRTGT